MKELIVVEVDKKDYKLFLEIQDCLKDPMKIPYLETREALAKRLLIEKAKRIKENQKYVENVNRLQNDIDKYKRLHMEQMNSGDKFERNISMLNAVIQEYKQKIKSNDKIY